MSVEVVVVTVEVDVPVAVTVPVVVLVAVIVAVPTATPGMMTLAGKATGIVTGVVIGMVTTRLNAAFWPLAVVFVVNAVAWNCATGTSALRECCSIRLLTVSAQLYIAVCHAGVVANFEGSGGISSWIRDTSFVPPMAELGYEPTRA